MVEYDPADYDRVYGGADDENKRETKMSESVGRPSRRKATKSLIV